MELSNLSVKYHVILITETWFNSDVIISDFVGSYYDVLRKDRNKFGGDVMLLVDKNLHSECLETLHINDVVESIWCKFKISNEIFVFGIIYKPPNCSNEYVDKMVDYINDIVELNQHCIFCSFVEIFTFLLLTGKYLMRLAIIVMRTNALNILLTMCLSK